MSETIQTTSKLNLEQECTCLFCGKSFKAKEIVFAKNEPSGAGTSLVDEVFAKTMEEYKLVEGEYAVEPPLRRFFSWSEKDVESTEEAPNGLIPRTVMGHLAIEQIRASKKRSFFDSDDEEASDDHTDETQEITLLSSVRLCPKCHMSLPEGFASEEIRRIGLLGGSRCGKTTYMVVACKYMENYLGLLSGGLDLGEVTFLQECNECLKKLYDSQRKAKEGASSTMQDASLIVEKPVFPIIAHITPSDKNYEPFYIIMQDIPGEYMLPEYQDKLINSAIPQSTDLISLVDINSLTWTKMKETSEYGEYCDLEPGELFKNFPVLGEALCSHHKLQTIQLCLTKLDFWLDADEKVGQGTVLNRDGNAEHRGSISDRRLSAISLQVNQRLKNVGGKDQSALMKLMLRSLNIEESGVHTAYTAVASRYVPDNEDMFDKDGMDYSTSRNVLEPLLNIFSWANLLPHDHEERDFFLTGESSEENEAYSTTEEQPRRSFFQRLFGKK